MQSFLKTSISGGHKHIEELDELIERVTKSGKENEDKVMLFQEILDSVSGHLKKITTLQHLVEYVKIQKDIEEISEELKSCIKGKDDHKTIGLYLSLSGDYQSTNSVLGRLQTIEAANLKDFATKTAVYWHDNLRDKFSRDFEGVLKSIKWPHFANMQVMEQSISKDALNKLTAFAEYLFLVSKVRLIFASPFLTIYLSSRFVHLNCKRRGILSSLLGSPVHQSVNR